MTYNEWRDELKSNLLCVSEQERARVLDYYAEAYADRRDAGYSEKEITAEFGARQGVYFRKATTRLKSINRIRVKNMEKTQRRKILKIANVLNHTVREVKSASGKTWHNTPSKARRQKRKIALGYSYLFAYCWLCRYSE